MRCDATDGLNLTVKLGASSEEVLQLPFTEPTGYGLGKSGWVTARFAAGDEPPLGILFDWIDDSYALVAPKKLVARLAAAADRNPGRRR
jgi:predicted DNA-binding protein (MmcQ/YjbR family)